MALADDINALSVPAEWRARQTTLGDEAEIVTGPTRDGQTHRELLEQFGYNTDEFEIVGTVNQWRKQQSNGEWLTSYFFKVAPREARLDLPALYAASTRRPKTPLKATADDGRVTVVALSDVQAGKTGSRGGTPELIDRLVEKREKLARELKRRRPERTVLAEVGDLFEGFENVASQQFTNDLSLAQQMDLAATEVYEFVTLMARHGHVDIVAVPSNHTAWRRGKSELGRPGDDLGLFVHKQVRKITTAARIDADWTIPAEHDESAVLDIHGTRLGVTHGHRANPGKLIDWWAKQQHGGQPVGAADILLSGHYHSLTVMPTGRNPYTGKAKWWLQAPTLDNGSDWFRNQAGEDSDPGLLVFDITTDGFDLQSLTVL